MNTTQLRINIAKNTNSARIYSQGNGQGWNLGPVFRETFPDKARSIADVKVQRAVLGPDARCSAGAGEDGQPNIACASHHMIWGTGILKYIRNLRDNAKTAAPIIDAMDTDHLLNLAGSIYDQARYLRDASDDLLDKAFSHITLWRFIEFASPGYASEVLRPQRTPACINKAVNSIDWSSVSLARRESNDDLNFGYDELSAFKDTASLLGIGRTAAGTRLDLLDTGDRTGTAVALDFARSLRMDPLLRFCASSWDSKSLLTFVLAVRNRMDQWPPLGPGHDSLERIEGWQKYLTQEICDRSGIE